MVNQMKITFPNLFAAIPAHVTMCGSIKYRNWRIRFHGAFLKWGVKPFYFLPPPASSSRTHPWPWSWRPHQGMVGYTENWNTSGFFQCMEIPSTSQTALFFKEISLFFKSLLCSFFSLNPKLSLTDTYYFVIVLWVFKCIFFSFVKV